MAMFTNTDTTTTKPMKRPLVQLQDKQLSLADLVLYLDEIDSEFVRFATLPDLASYEAPSPHTGLPVYRVVPVTLWGPESTHPKNHVYMVFVDNGMIYFQNQDRLDLYKLDEPHFFDNIVIDHTPHPATQFDFELVRAPHGHKNWTFQYEIESILSTFHLLGGQDIASFAGFFYTQ